MENPKAYNEIMLRLGDRKWRIANLYYIIDANGKKIKFNPNVEQWELINNMHFKNIIPKARKLGISTYIDLQILDFCLFNSNKTGAIISDTLQNGKSLLAKAKYAYKNLPEELKASIRLIKDDETEIQFSNGSRFYVTTSSRGGTIQYLHVSEYGPIGKDSKLKELEIKNGAMNSLGEKGILWVESTAIGPEGDFYKLCSIANEKKASGTIYDSTDYKLFFFPWWNHTDYAVTCPIGYVFNNELVRYFQEVENATGAKLTTDQKYWYAKKKEAFGADIFNEFPSTFAECFESHSEDKYYLQLFMEALQANRICEFPVERGVKVHTVLDCGFSDYTSIIFFQKIGKELRIVDFIEGSGEEISFYGEQIIKKNYLLGDCWLPHDAFNGQLSGKNTATRMKEMGFNVKRVEELSIQQGIDAGRALFPRCWFRLSTTQNLTNHLKNYKKKWNDSTGTYTGPKHDEHSHASDAFRYLAVCLKEEKPQHTASITPTQSITSLLE